MRAILPFTILAASHLASAHFALTYPEWRADTLTLEDEYSQYTWPCAGVPADAGNRTDWPLTGGSLKLGLHHKWTYLFVNLGLGDNVTNFNYTLTPSLWNETGNGTLCLPTLPLPVNLNVTDGTRATIQVVTSGETGSALYNCADITFRSSAQPLDSSECVTSPGVSVAAVSQQANESTSTNNTSSDTNTTTGDAGKSAGSVQGVNTVALTSAAGLAVAFVVGMSW